MTSSIVAAVLVVTAAGVGCQQATGPAPTVPTEQRAGSSKPAREAAKPKARGYEHKHKHHNHSFEDVERFAKAFDDPKRDSWQKPDEVLRLCGAREGAVVADIGAGTGYFVSRISATVGPSGTVLAVDSEIAMVRYMKERGAREGWRNVSIIHAQTSDPKLPAAACDCVLIVNTWHHIEDRVAYAKTVMKALKPGGRLLIVDYGKPPKSATGGKQASSSPQGPTSAAHPKMPVGGDLSSSGDGSSPRHWPPPGHGPPMKMRLSRGEVFEELQKAGFAVELPMESLPYQYVVRGRFETK